MGISDIVGCCYSYSKMESMSHSTHYSHIGYTRPCRAGMRMFLSRSSRCCSWCILLAIRRMHSWRGRPGIHSNHTAMQYLCLSLWPTSIPSFTIVILLYYPPFYYNTHMLLNNNTTYSLSITKY